MIGRRALHRSQRNPPHLVAALGENPPLRRPARDLAQGFERLRAGTGEGYFREEVRGTWLPLRGAGIFWTADGGASWQLLEGTDTPDFHWVNDLVTSARHPGRLLAATRTGVWVWEDGAGWSHLLEAQEHGGCLDLELRTDRPNDWLFAACGTLG